MQRCFGCRRLFRFLSPTDQPWCSQCPPRRYPGWWRELGEEVHPRVERKHSSRQWIPWWRPGHLPSFPTRMTHWRSANPIDLQRKVNSQCSNLTPQILWLELALDKWSSWISPWTAWTNQPGLALGTTLEPTVNQPLVLLLKTKTVEELGTPPVSHTVVASF